MFADKEPLSLDAVTKVAFCLEGRDKITKLAQYGGRMMAWYYLSADPNSELGQRLNSLYKTAQQSRKAFRVGKSVNEYNKVLKAYNDKTLIPWQQTLTVLKHTGMAGYLMYDNMVFFSRAKVFDFDAKEASKRGGVLWFMANVSALLLAISTLKKDRDLELYYESLLLSTRDNDQVSQYKAKLSKIKQTRPKKVLAVIKSLCDLIVSSNTSGIRLAERLRGSKLHDGIMGGLGCISASIVLYNTWPSKK